MKNWITIVMVLASTFAFAQDFEISEAPRALNNEINNSFLFVLPNVEKDMAEEEWKKFMKDFKGKSKYDKKAKHWRTESAKIGQLSNDPVDVETQFVGNDDANKKTSVIVWFKLNDGSFVSSETDEMKGGNAKNLLNKYALSTAKSSALEVLKAQEKLLSGLQKDLKKLEKENKDFNNEIEKAKKAIAQNEKNIEENKEGQKLKKQEIEAQLKAVNDAKTIAKKFK